MSQNPEPERASYEAPNAATTLFDLRTVIALLFAVYGVILTLMGLFGSSQAELDKAGGINLNLWTGIGMLIVAAIFLGWVWRSRPLTSQTQEG
jgi:hypothetical protein